MIIKNAKVFMDEIGCFENLDIRVVGGKIAEVAEKIEVGSEEVIDAKNCFVTPGIIEAHSHIGMYEEGIQWEGDDICENEPVTPEMRSIDAIFPGGQYRKIVGGFYNGVLTGKARSFGGSLVRPEATGYGSVYYVEAVMKHENDTLVGKTVALAGFGNVAWGAAKKLAELGAKAVTLSGPDGYIYDPEGITTEEKINYMLEMRASGRNKVQDYADKFGVQFFPGEKPWGQKVDIIMPCATQNDVDLEQAKKIVANNVKYYIEVANMPTTNEALRFLMQQPNMVVAPSKAVNAGGVLVSGFEMSQNSERLSWTAEEVDSKLHQVMTDIHDGSAAAAERYGLGYNLVAGANIVGFQKIADAMMAQGIAW